MPTDCDAHRALRPSGSPAGARCRSTGPLGAARPSAPLLCKGVTRGPPAQGEGPLPRPRVPLAQRSAAFIPLLPPSTSPSASNSTPPHGHRAVRAHCPSSSAKACIAVAYRKAKLACALQKLLAWHATWRRAYGRVIARTCDSSRLGRQSQSEHLHADGLDLLSVG